MKSKNENNAKTITRIKNKISSRFSGENSQSSTNEIDYKKRLE